MTDGKKKDQRRGSVEDEELWVEGVGRGGKQQRGRGNQRGRWNGEEPGGVVKQKAERG